MSKGQHIHMARLSSENHNMKAASTQLFNAQANMEVSMLKLRISVLEDDIKRRDQEIERLTNKLNRK